MEYMANKVSGGPIMTAPIRYKTQDNLVIKDVHFSDNSIYMTGVDGKKNVYIKADYQGATLCVDDSRWQERGIGTFGKLGFKFNFDVDKYTITIVEDPVEMTISDIEKKLGHKVVIVNEKTKDGDK